MSSDEDNDSHSSNPKDSNKRNDFYNEIYTQEFDDSQSTFDDLGDLNDLDYPLTVPFDDTVPVENETQQVEDLGCDENLMTQLLIDDTEVQVFTEEEDEENGEGSDRTEALTDIDGVSDDEGDTNVRVDSDPSLEEERRGSGQKASTIPSVDKNIEEPNSGSAPRSFMSIRAASLRAAGLAAARRKSTEGTETEPGSNPSNNQPIKDQISIVDANTDLGHQDLIDKKEMDSDSDRDCEVENVNENINGLKDEIKNKSAVRRLFTIDEPSETNPAINDNDSITEGIDLPELDNGNEFAGLSYVNSQEPGELSQANALDAIDKFLSVNNVECSPVDEVYPIKTTKNRSPAVPSAKGPRALACRTNTGSPVGKLGPFDWDDNREDEGGGEFFSRKKDVLFKSDTRRRRSFTQPKKPRHLSSGKGKSVNTEPLGFCQKITRSIHSDSRLFVPKSKVGEETVRVSENKTKKNLFEEMDEQLNPEASGQQSEGLDIGNNPREMYDVGIDTQMAAEAMEALGAGVEAHIDTVDASELEPNMGGVRKKKSQLKQASGWKRTCRSDEGGISKQSKRKKTLDTRLSSEVPISSRTRSNRSKVVEELEVKTKQKKARPEAEEQAGSKNHVGGYEKSGRRSSKSVGGGKQVKAVEKSHAQEVDKCHDSSASEGNHLSSKVPLAEDSRVPTPVARRTRRSQAVNTSKKTENFNESRERKNEQTEANDLGGKRLRGKMGINDGKKTEQIQHEHMDLDELTAKNPRGKRSCQRVSVHLKEPDDLDGSSTVVEVVVEANGQSISKPNRVKVDVRSTPVNYDLKRKTRSATSRKPTPSPGTNSEGNLLKQQVPEKIIPTDPVEGKTLKHTGTKTNADCMSTPEGVTGRDNRLEGSPGEKVKPSDSLCVTPVNCTKAINASTPLNEASPICIGNNYLKLSNKRSFSKPSLIRELNTLYKDGVSTPEFKDSRKRRDIGSVCVLFSRHLDQDTLKHQKKILARLGVSITSSSSEATHFVTDKFVRTKNMLEAIALGKPVVTNLWVESCGQANCFIDEKNYILRDAKKEKEIGFSMPVSLARACQSPLLEGRKVFLTPNIKPDRELVAGLVKAVHGQAVERIGRFVMKDEKVLEDLLVLSCEEDYEICIPLLEKGVAIYSSELLLNGIVIQKLEYERHRLFNDNVKRTRSTIWIKKDGDQFRPVNKRK